MIFSVQSLLRDAVEIHCPAKTWRVRIVTLGLLCGNCGVKVSGARKIHASLDEFEEWVDSVEHEPDRMTRIHATQAYIVYHEDDDSSQYGSSARSRSNESKV